MGKRELVIAAIFIALGFGVYRLTAPPGDPSERGFSLSRIINEVRREISGQRANAETTFTATQAVPGTVTGIRLDFAVGAVTVIGEDRDDIDARMHVRSTGYDAAEAERLAKASILKFDEAGALLIITGSFPREGRQTPAVTLRVPSRLAVQMDEKGSALEISNVASVQVGAGRGPTTIQHITGNVTLAQRGSEVTVNDVGSLKLTAAGGAESRVSGVRGDTVLSVQTGELRAEDLRGSLEVESRSAELLFDKLDNLTGSVRVTANMGEVTFTGLRADTRIDGRSTEIRVDFAGPAPLAIYNEGETIEVTLPSTGFTMDARAVGGDISAADGLLQAGLTEDGDPDYAKPEDGATQQETRVTGGVRGGGPLITLRATRGDIVLRAR